MECCIRLDQVRGHALAGYEPPGWDMLRAIRHPCFSGPFSRRIPSAVPTQSPTRTSSPRGHQLPPPEMRPWGSQPVTSEGLSHACSPRNPATSCTGSPKQHPAPCDPTHTPHRHGQASGHPAPRGGFAGAPRSHFTGGENRSTGSCSGVSRPAAGSVRVLSIVAGGGWGGLLLPCARCRLVRGTAPPAYPIITFPPSLQKNIS